MCGLCITSLYSIACLSVQVTFNTWPWYCCCSTPDALHKLDDSVQFLLYWVHAMSARHKQHKTNKLLATQNLEAGLQVNHTCLQRICVTRHRQSRHHSMIERACIPCLPCGLPLHGTAGSSKLVGSTVYRRAPHSSAAVTMLVGL